jgi:hypothetical protein
VINLAEKALGGAFDDVPTLLVETSRAFAGIQHDAVRSGLARTIFQRPQNHAAESAALCLRINGHETDLCFARRVQMKATSRERLAVRRPHHQVDAFVLAIVALGTPRLLPGRPEDAPAKIEIAFEFGFIGRGNERGAVQRTRGRVRGIIHNGKMRPPKKSATANIPTRESGDQ